MTKCALLFQKRYMLKFSTDGAMLTNKKNTVQGTIQIFQVKDGWIPIMKGSLPKYLNQELPVYYFIGTSTNPHSIGVQL